jgi:uncharacterized protein YjbJ (UPF0337 family)
LQALQRSWQAWERRWQARVLPVLPLPFIPVLPVELRPHSDASARTLLAEPGILLMIGREASEGFPGTAPPPREFPKIKPRRHQMIDKDRIKGAAEQAKGKAKEWTGKATGDKKMEVEGKADQVKGKVQNTVGGAKDAMRDK